MTYHNAVKFVSEAPNSNGGKLSFERLSYASALLGNPHKKLNYIRLAGSNGKTICSALLSSVLCKAGYNVCKLTISTLDEVRENIRHNTQPISMPDFTEAVQTVSELCNTIRENIDAAKKAQTEEGLLPEEYKDIPRVLLDDKSSSCDFSRAEILLLAALYFYRKRGCDICVIESSHNTFDPSLFLNPPFAAVICGAIPSDDKKQMIKIQTYIQRGIREVISAPQDTHAYKMISDTCAAANCRLSVPVRSALTVKQLSLIGTSFVYSGEGYRLSLCGRFQTTNAITVIETLKVLRRCGYNISAEAEKAGLAAVKVPSRFEVISVNPTIICDSTYKLEAIETICESLFDFSESVGRTLSLCLPCDTEIVKKYLRMLSDRGYTVTDIYTIATDEASVTSLVSVLPESITLNVFSTPKATAKSILSSLSRDSLVFVSGRHLFSSSIRRELMRKMDF